MITRIFFLLATLLLLPAWVIGRYGCKRCPAKRRQWMRWLLWLPNLVLVVLLATVALTESYGESAALWKARLLTLTLLLSIPETLYSLLLPLARWRVGRWLQATVTLTVFCALLYGFTVGWQQLTVRNYTYASPDVPQAFDGYRIVQISDLHLGTFRGHEAFVKRIADSVNAQNPDLICLTGDLVNYQPTEMIPFMRELRELRARDGVLSIMGNHDYLGYFHWRSPEEQQTAIAELQASQRTLGWHLLMNSHRRIRRAQDSIAVIGLENDGPPRFPALANIRRATAGLDTDCFRIILEHDPSYWRRANPQAGLMLSGHTHGMQLRLFGWSPAAWFYPEWGGTYQDARYPSTLYVSTGVGSVLLPFRFGAWPEINVITLRRHAL